MKKKSIAISLALAAVLATVPALAACSGDHYSAVKFDAQDVSYAVTSQGGNAVAYGNYIYFINGYRGYDDAEGTSNVWNETVKGALYRAELNGTKKDGTPATFAPEVIDALEFKYTESTDYYDNPVNVVDVTAIAPKTVGTSGYANGGIFIYDNYVYFASPNNSKNAVGTVQTTRTDFFMMPLSGGSPVKFYTTSEGVDTSSSAYAFYKYGGAVYLVVNEGSDIVSVRINTDKAKADDAVKFEVGATSVFFPVRDTYYNGIDANTLEDFIYFVRDVKEDSGEQKSGSVIEAMRPDGGEGFIVAMHGKSETIEAVRDGVFFYRTTDTQGNTVIAYDSLHEALMEKSPTYAAAQELLPVADRNKQFSGQFSTAISDSITATYVFRDDDLLKSNEVRLVGVTSSAINIYAPDGTLVSLTATTGTPKFIKNNYLYFGGSSAFYRVAMQPNMEDYGEAVELAGEAATATFDCDYVDGYFTYFAKVDDWASDYAYFYKVDGIKGMEAQFVGERAEDDKPTDEELENIKNGEDDSDT